MRKDSQKTRAKLIRAAEKLFARQGLESTSLLQIIKHAKVNNRSAMQYHFKNKEGLIKAILDKHTHDLSNRCKDLLQELRERDDYDLRDVVEVLVLPFAEKLDERDGGREFLLLHGQLMLSEKYKALRKESVNFAEETKRLFFLMQPFVPPIDQKSVMARSLICETLLFQGLSAYLTHEKLVRRDEFIQSLIGTISANFALPEISSKPALSAVSANAS